MDLETKVNVEKAREMREYILKHPGKFIARTALEPGYVFRQALGFPKNMDKRKVMAMAIGFEIARLGYVAYIGYQVYQAFN